MTGGDGGAGVARTVRPRHVNASPRAVDAGHLELLGPVAHTGDEAQTAAGDERGRRELLRETDRVVQRHEDRRDVDRDPLRARRDRRRERHGRRHVAVLDAVMFRDRDHVEAGGVRPFAHVETRRVLRRVRRVGERCHPEIEAQADHRRHGAASSRRAPRWSTRGAAG